MLVAIDGPAGAGKSTVARAVARTLGFAYLDTGAMYRCVALLALERPDRAPAELARSAAIELRRGGAALAGDVRLNGHDVSEQIRAPEVSEAASLIAADACVRDALVAKQRELIAIGDWVVEGRDIGSVVAPDARLKVFLTADASERARRRATELGVDPATVLSEQRLRDERDAAREHGPLRAAPGAIVLDTTGSTVEQVVARIVALVPGARNVSSEEVESVTEPQGG